MVSTAYSDHQLGGMEYDFFHRIVASLPLQVQAHLPVS